MKRYMLDTNMVSHFIKGHPGVARQVVTLPMAALCVTAITEGELRFGLAKRPDAKRLHLAVQEFLRCVEVLPWDGDVARHYGATRATLERQGKMLGSLDMLIAAHAASIGAVLVTNDRAFAQINGLVIEDWTTL